jgi:hypothetical protein
MPAMNDARRPASETRQGTRRSPRRRRERPPFRIASERVRLYSRPGNDLTKRLDQDEEPRLRGALKREATIGWGMSMGNTLHSILIRLVAYVAVVIAAGLLFLAGATVYELMWPRPVVPFSQMSRP